jgi:hypothetical protein
LGYAFKIIENAYESKVSEMIIEIRQLNESLNEKIVTVRSFSEFLMNNKHYAD